MRKVELRMNELEKYNIIKNLVDNNGNKNVASIKLRLSRRQIDRLIIKYKEKGWTEPQKLDSLLVRGLKPIIDRWQSF